MAPRTPAVPRVARPAGEGRGAAPGHVVVAEAAVLQCHRVSPGPDFILTLQVADMPSWSALVDRLFTQDANVRNVKSFFSVRRAKFETRIALPAPRA